MTFLVMGRSQDRMIGVPGAGSCFGRTKIRGVGSDIGMVAVGNTHRECRSEYYDPAHLRVSNHWLTEGSTNFGYNHHSP